MTASLRDRSASEARAGDAGLFFDLAYAFAVTQVSHTMLHSLTPLGALQTLARCGQPCHQQPRPRPSSSERRP